MESESVLIEFEGESAPNKILLGFMSYPVRVQVPKSHEGALIVNNLDTQLDIVNGRGDALGAGMIVSTASVEQGCDHTAAAVEELQQRAK